MAENVSANDIVPESYQMRLMMWRDEFTRGYFEIGDIANEIVVLNIQKGMKLDQNIIYSAIGKFCGKSGRTVRDYAEVASFFPVNMRDEYDVLPFSHFRYAKSCGIRYQDVLDYSLENPSASVDSLEVRFNCRSKTEIESPAKEEKLPAINVPVVQSASEIIALGNLISQTEKLLGWDIDRKIKDELMVSLGGLKHVLLCLSGEEKAMKFEYNNIEE